MELILGIDLGTSYFKLGLFDRAGKLHGLGKVPVQTDNGDGSLCELPVERFWAVLRQGLDDALAEAGAAAEDVAAMAYSSQANSFILLDEHDKPLTPLILWPDARAGQIDPAVRQLSERDDFLGVTGIGIGCDNQFAVAKLKWFQRQCPELWAGAARIMTISDYLVFSLTGRAVGDAGTASLLGLWDVSRQRWWDDALRLIGIAPSQLSPPLAPGTAAGNLTAEATGRLGLKPAIPLAVGSLDHHVAAIGAGVGQACQFSESTGTVLACLRLTDEFNPMRNCCAGPGVGGRGYYQLAFENNGASVLEWYHRNHAPRISIPELVAMAADIPPGSDGLIALPSANKYSDLDGFLSRTPDHKHGHFVRAIMESTAASLMGLVDNLCREGRPSRIVATGGGARSDLWLQMKADMLDVEFVAPACKEPACMGAAMLGSVAAGWFADLADAAKAWAADRRVFRADPETHAAYLQWHRRYIEITATP
ncbi:MAG: hypothetical protein K8S55_12610 [Phycisphaerae bacterium]|nr:hypothetical protein [Phycisphaerae bacterium]